MADAVEDYEENAAIVSTLDSLYIFTDKGRVFQLKAHDIPDESSQGRVRLPRDNRVQ